MNMPVDTIFYDVVMRLPEASSDTQKSDTYGIRTTVEVRIVIITMFLARDCVTAADMKLEHRYMNVACPTASRSQI